MKNSNGSVNPVPLWPVVACGEPRFVRVPISCDRQWLRSVHEPARTGRVWAGPRECYNIPVISNLNPQYCQIEVCDRSYAMALTSQVTVCGKAITMTSASPCRAMNGKAPLWMSMTFTSLGATVWR